MRKFFEKLFPRKPIASTGPKKRKRTPLRRVATVVRRKLPKDLDSFEQSLRNVNVDTVAAKATWIRWGIIVLSVFLASAISSRIIALLIRPQYAPLPPKPFSVAARVQTPTEDFTPIEQRNIFDVENKIPPPFDQGLLDCMSQAKLSTNTSLTLEGTVVMGDDSLSVALVSEQGDPEKVAVKKNDVFFDKYQAMKVERKKLCFQVRECAFGRDASRDEHH